MLVCGLLKLLLVIFLVVYPLDGEDEVLVHLAEEPRFVLVVLLEAPEHVLDPVHFVLVAHHVGDRLDDLVVVDLAILGVLDDLVDLVDVHIAERTLFKGFVIATVQRAVKTRMMQAVLILSGISLRLCKYRGERREL